MIDNITTLLIADDHPIFRIGLREVLKGAPDYKIITEAENGEQAISSIKTYQPDIALLDISMPKKNGLDVVAELQNWSKAPAFVILSLYDDEVYLRKALAHKVLGYILKENTHSELLKCLDTVKSGKRYLCSSMTEKAFDIEDNTNNILQSLSPTEHRIFTLVADLKTNADIADILSMSVRTVENHRFHICKKLDLQGTNALAKFALSLDI